MGSFCPTISLATPKKSTLNLGLSELSTSDGASRALPHGLVSASPESPSASLTRRPPCSLPVSLLLKIEAEVWELPAALSPVPSSQPDYHKFTGRLHWMLYLKQRVAKWLQMVGPKLPNKGLDEWLVASGHSWPFLSTLSASARALLQWKQSKRLGMKTLIPLGYYYYILYYIFSQ